MLATLIPISDCSKHPILSSHALALCKQASSGCVQSTRPDKHTPTSTEASIHMQIVKAKFSLEYFWFKLVI